MGSPAPLGFRLLLCLAAGCGSAASGSAQSAPSPAIAWNLAGASPAPGASGVCPDTPLRLTFPRPPMLGSAGKIRLYDETAHTLADTIDVSSPTAIRAIGGLNGFRVYPVIVRGSQAAIYFRNHAMTYGHAYAVTIDPGVFRDEGRPYAGLSEPTSWRFGTRPAPPPPGATHLTVAADGSGDFCTVQGALDFIPKGNTRPTEIFLRRGAYEELIFFTAKNAITIRGEDREGSVIAYANNDRFNKSGGNPYATGADPSNPKSSGGHIYHRGVFIAHRVQDLRLENLTIRNTTPHGGSQSEAIILNGTQSARAILKDVDLYSYQDTLQINGQAYLTGCRIYGDVDFMWGTGPCFFQDCLCRAVTSDGYYTQIRNPGSNHGFVYDRCIFDGAPGVAGVDLSRIEPDRFPRSEVVLIDCQVGPSAARVGWLLQRKPGTPVSDASQLHFWEYHSHDASGHPIDVSGRLPASRQLTEPADAATISHYSDPAYVLGGWKPKL